MKRLIQILCTLSLLLLISGVGRADSVVEATMNSRFLMRGERGTLELVMRSEFARTELDEIPVISPIRNVSIRSERRGLQRRPGNGRRNEYFLPYTISSYEPGTYTIPSIEVSIAGSIHKTDPIKFKVIDETTLDLSTVSVGNQRIRYYAKFFTLKENPYVGEKQPVELKVYFPANQRLLDYGIPEFERDGVSVWRLQPERRPIYDTVEIAGRAYFPLPYPSTVSTNDVGSGSLGPAELRLQLQFASVQDFGRGFAQPVTLQIPALELESKPLPDGAPEGFENAIGDFDITVTTRQTEVREGDPVTLEIAVKGTGNLDSLTPPKPLDSEGWKLYDATTVERGDERRSVSGEVIFRQFMRPLRAQSVIPPFRLVYFDPDKELYDTLLSEAIPLNVLPSTAPSAMSAPPQALSMPVEEMTDILGVVNFAPQLLPERKYFPSWIWQLLPALLAIGLLVKIAVQKIAPRLKKDPIAIEREREWRDVEKAPNQAGDFYRRVGHFIERWLGDRHDPLISEVLEKRDQVCFRRETSEARLDRSERQRVLKQLRRIALPLVALFAVVSTPSGHAQDEDPGKLYKDGLYSDAAEQWLQSGPYERLSADTLFNIGNAAYRLGSPGEAALYYRRALNRDSSHAEARQNLRFLERKFGSITIKRPDYQYLVARVSLATWKSLIWTAGWIILLGILVFPATRPGALVRVGAIVGFVVAPLLAICGLLAWKYYPDDARFAPTKDQVVVVANAAKVRTDAARTAPQVIEAPAGSLCELITRSGEWGYVAFTNESRGWIPLVDIEPILPETTPTPPKARLLKDSETNA